MPFSQQMEIQVPPEPSGDLCSSRLEYSPSSIPLNKKKGSTAHCQGRYGSVYVRVELSNIVVQGAAAMFTIAVTVGVLLLNNGHSSFVSHVSQVNI